MSRLLIASIDRFGPLKYEVRSSLAACSQTTLQASPGQSIVLPGEPSQLRVLATGLAVRQQLLPDGSRQILGFLLPGDLLDLSGMFTGGDHEVRALSTCEVLQTTPRETRSLVRQHPSLLAALCRAVLTEAKLQRNWMVGLGRRSAAARTANLFCEIFARQQALGLAREDCCRFPVLQADIADALGLSVVHTSRLARPEAVGPDLPARRRPGHRRLGETGRAGGIRP